MTIPRLIATCLLAALSALGVHAEPGSADAETRAIISQLGLRAASTPSSALPGWQPRRVVVSAPPMLDALLPDYAQRLQTAAGDVELVIDRSGSFGVAPELLAGADALIGFCEPANLAAADHRFRWLHNYFVGMDRCAGLSEEQIAGRVFTNGKRLSGPTIAEHSIAMLLSIVRGLPAYGRAQAQNQWQTDLAQQLRFGELQGKTLLVAGLGGIGTEVARRAHGLGMRVIATRNSSRSGPEFVDYVGLADELHKLAGEAHVVVNALPLTAKTRGLFDAEFFKQLPPGAIFISVGRGQSTVTADLVTALKSGHLYGAGLDVTDPEPLPADSPLWQMDNVIITPHRSGAGGDALRRGLLIAVENLRRYVAGEPLLNTVNMAAGY